MRRTILTVAALVVGSALLAAAPRLASAQEDTDERVDQARVLFDQAEAHFAAGRFLPAAGDYQRAYDLMHEAGRSTAPLILYNVGRAYDRAGRVDEARAAYERFVGEAPADDAEAQARVGTARERLRALRAPAPTPVTPPPVAQTQSAPEVAVAPTPATRTVTESSMSPVGPIVMAAGGALLIAGFSVGGVALAQDGDLSSRCPSREACDPSLQADYDGTRTLATAGDVLWIIGAATVAAGLVLTFVLSDEADSASASLQCGPAGCAASLQGTF